MTVLMRGMSVKTVMVIIPSVRKRSIFSLLNSAWRKKCGIGAQLLAYGLTIFGIAQKGILAFCI
jgi:hypothetical protein